MTIITGQVWILVLIIILISMFMAAKVNARVKRPGYATPSTISFIVDKHF